MLVNYHDNVDDEFDMEIKLFVDCGTEVIADDDPTSAEIAALAEQFGKAISGIRSRKKYKQDDESCSILIQLLSKDK